MTSPGCAPSRRSRRRSCCWPGVGISSASSNWSRRNARNSIRSSRTRTRSARSTRNWCHSRWHSIQGCSAMARSTPRRSGMSSAKQDDARYQKVIEDKNRFRYRAKVELVVAQLDQSVGFRDEQRRKLVELIVSETQPPTRFGQYDYYLVMYQAGKIAEAKLKPLFEDRQWALAQSSVESNEGDGAIPAKPGPSSSPQGDSSAAAASPWPRSCRRMCSRLPRRSSQRSSGS